MEDESKGYEFVIDSCSRYFLPPSYAFGAIISTTHFDGKSFDIWEKAVITALTTKNKIAFIDRTITNPNMKKGGNQAQMNAWIIVNSKITSWILNVVEPRLYASIAYAVFAQAIWENI